MTAKDSFLFVSLPPEDQEKSLVYQNLKAKVVNGSNPYGDISNFPIPQFKVHYFYSRYSSNGRLAHWIRWLY